MFRILVVDDLHLDLEALGSVLRGGAVEISIVADSATALEVSRATKPNLVLVGPWIPVRDPFDLCFGLKSDAATADIPVVDLSSAGYREQTLNNLLLEAGAALSKPISGRELLVSLQALLTSSIPAYGSAREQEIRLAGVRAAQRAILVQPADVPGAKFAVFYAPLDEAGGDFYDVLEIKRDVFGYFAADISGHGAGAAMLTSALKVLVHQYTGPLYSPLDTMRELDSAMRRLLTADQFVTACYARFNRRTRTLDVVNAGHPPILVVSKDGAARSLRIESNPIGLFTSGPTQQVEFILSPEDRFYLYSDGIVETKAGSGSVEGYERLVKACIARRENTLTDALPMIAADVHSAYRPAEDDRLLLGVEVSP